METTDTTQPMLIPTSFLGMRPSQTPLDVAHSHQTVPHASPTGSHSGAVVPQKRPVDDPNDEPTSKKLKLLPCRAPLRITDEIILKAKEKGSKYWQPLYHHRCSLCHEEKVACDKTETAGCTNCRGHNIKCERVPVHPSQVKRDNYRYIMEVRCTVEPTGCKRCKGLGIELYVGCEATVHGLG